MPCQKPIVPSIVSAAGEKEEKIKTVILLKGHIARNDVSRAKISTYIKVEFPKLFRKEHKKDSCS